MNGDGTVLASEKRLFSEVNGSVDPSWVVGPCLQIGDQVCNEVEEDLKIHVLGLAAKDESQQRKCGVDGSHG